MFILRCFVGRRCVETLRRIFGLHLLAYGRQLRQSLRLARYGSAQRAISFAVRRPDAQIQLNFGHLYFRIFSGMLCVLFRHSFRSVSFLRLLLPPLADVEYIIARRVRTLKYLQISCKSTQKSPQFDYRYWATFVNPTSTPARIRQAATISLVRMKMKNAQKMNKQTSKVI